MTNIEKETIILFNESEPTAKIETFNGRLLRSLRKVEKCEGVICEKSETGYGVYIIPKTMIKIYAPPKLSEKHKKDLINRLTARTTT